MNENIFYVFAEMDSKKRLVTLGGGIYELTNELTAPRMEESEFVNMASLFQKPNLAFLETAQPSKSLDNNTLSNLYAEISGSNFFKAYKGGKNLGTIQPNSQEALLWIFNDVLSSTWCAKGDQTLEGIVKKVLYL